MLPSRLPDGVAGASSQISSNNSKNNNFLPIELYKAGNVLILHKPVNWLCNTSNRHQIRSFQPKIGVNEGHLVQFLIRLYGPDFPFVCHSDKSRKSPKKINLKTGSKLNAFGLLCELDRDVSGPVVVALNAETHKQLAQGPPPLSNHLGGGPGHTATLGSYGFQNGYREGGKEFLVLIHGHVNLFEKASGWCGSIDTPLCKSYDPLENVSRVSECKECAGKMQIRSLKTWPSCTNPGCLNVNEYTDQHERGACKTLFQVLGYFESSGSHNDNNDDNDDETQKSHNDHQPSLKNYYTLMAVRAGGHSLKTHQFRTHLQSWSTEPGNLIQYDEEDVEKKKNTDLEGGTGVVGDQIYVKCEKVKEADNLLCPHLFCHAHKVSFPQTSMMTEEDNQTSEAGSEIVVSVHDPLPPYLKQTLERKLTPVAHLNEMLRQKRGQLSSEVVDPAVESGIFSFFTNGAEEDVEEDWRTPWSVPGDLLEILQERSSRKKAEEQSEKKREKTVGENPQGGESSEEKTPTETSSKTTSTSSNNSLKISLQHPSVPPRGPSSSSRGPGRGRSREVVDVDDKKAIKSAPAGQVLLKTKKLHARKCLSLGKMETCPALFVEEDRPAARLDRFSLFA